MERSRFWKVRNWFFDLKRRVGLSADGGWPPLQIPPEFETALHGANGYATWLRRYAPRESDLARLREVVPLLPLRPTISLILDGARATAAHMDATLESVAAQVYPAWQLVVVSPPAQWEAGDAAHDERICIIARPSPEARSACGAALTFTSGEFIAFLDPGDRLTPDALYELALAVNRRADAVMVYSDEDELGSDGMLAHPFFKPDWAPDSYLSRQYVGQLAAFRREAIEHAGGIRADFPAWREDLVLRIGETGAPVLHIPRVLYHRRAARPSEAARCDQRSIVQAIEEALMRRNEPGHVAERTDAPGIFSVRYAVAEAGPVTIIVPTRDHCEDVDRCVGSILERTRYDGPWELLLVDNGSTDRASLDALAKWKARDDRIRIVRDPSPFNFSRLNNRAVAQSSGEYLLFLNNDTQVLTDDWISAMVEQAQRPSVGGVGALLLYPDGKVQHAGVVLGIGGVASHGHKSFERDAYGYHGALQATCNYAALTAACLMVRRSVFDEVGGFDEELPVTFNDVDLCLKMLRAGYRNVYLSHVVVMHEESKTRGKDVSLQQRLRSLREQSLMRERWRTLIDDDPYYNPNLTRAADDFSIRLD